MRTVDQIVDAGGPTRDTRHVLARPIFVAAIAVALVFPAAARAGEPTAAPSTGGAAPADAEEEASEEAPAEAKAPPPTAAPSTKPSADKPADAKDAAAKPAESDPNAPEKADPRVRPIEPGEGRPGPYAPDERTGHVYIRGGTALVLPAGSIRSEVPANAVVGPGIGFLGSVGVGISRHAELDVMGGYALMQRAGGQGGGQCVGCKGDHASVSLGLTYHLAQGVALDPWMRFGTGYRTASYAGTSPQLVNHLVAGRFHGWDVAQISLGATFYPVSSFGLGPFFETDLGSYLNRPAANGYAGGARVYAFFQLGLRLELDPVRWVSKPAPTPAKRSIAQLPPSF